MQGLNEEAWFPGRVKGEERGRRCDQHSAKTWRLSGGQWGTADYSKAGGGSSLRPVTSQTTLVFTHAMYSQPPCDRRWCGFALTANLSRFFKRECRISHNVLWFSCSLLPESVILLFLSSSTLHIPLLMHPQSVILDTSKTSKAHHSAWHTAGAGQWMRNEKSTEISTRRSGSALNDSYPALQAQTLIWTNRVWNDVLCSVRPFPALVL